MKVFVNISGSCSTVLNFWTEIINVTSPDSVHVGGVPFISIRLRSGSADRDSGASVAARSFQF